MRKLRRQFLLPIAFLAAAVGLQGQIVLNPPPHRLQPLSHPLTLPRPLMMATTVVFDQDVKQYNASPGEEAAPFTFKLTNVASNELIVMGVHASCGCTTARLPPLPWHIPPGGSGEIQAEVRLAGKMGLVIKTLTFTTSAGTKMLTLKVNIPSPSQPVGELSGSERQAAMARAAADAHAIFRGDCASCHVEKGRHALGQELYAADCGICHESPHRASVVPDLHALKEPTGLAFWKTVITYGKPHSMMPGFSQAEGGPLDNDQIASLAAYLDRTISHHF